MSDVKGDLAYGIIAGVENHIGKGTFLAVEAEFSASQGSASATDLFEDGGRVKLSAGRDLYAGVKIGVEVAPAIILYAKGGYIISRSGAVTRTQPALIVIT